jgi:hypothetical protein
MSGWQEIIDCTKCRSKGTVVFHGENRGDEIEERWCLKCRLYSVRVKSLMDEKQEIEYLRQWGYMSEEEWKQMRQDYPAADPYSSEFDRKEHSGCVRLTQLCQFWIDEIRFECSMLTSYLGFHQQS